MYENEKYLYKLLLEHPKDEVVSWAKKMLVRLDEAIKAEENFDEETDLMFPNFSFDRTKGEESNGKKLDSKTNSIIENKNKPFINDLVEKEIEEVKKVLKKYNVNQASFFGSCVDKNKTNFNDVDIIVSFKEKLELQKYTETLQTIKDELEAIFTKKVDVVDEDSLSNQYFIKNINNSKVPINLS